MTEKLTNTSLRRGLRCLASLKGQTLAGLGTNEIAQALGESPSAISRTMQTLVDEGWAQKLESGRWALSILALGIAESHRREVERVSSRLTEINNRVAAAAQQ